MDQNHTHTAGFHHRQTLVDARRNAAITNHNFTGHQRRIENVAAIQAGVAERHLGWIAPARPAAVESISEL